MHLVWADLDILCHSRPGSVSKNPPVCHVLMLCGSIEINTCILSRIIENDAVMLREKGLHPFRDTWNIVPGEPIENTPIDMKRRCYTQPHYF